VELIRRRCDIDRAAGAQAGRHIGAGNAVSSLLTCVRRDVAAHPVPGVVRAAIVDVGVPGTRGRVVRAVGSLEARPATDFQAHIGAGYVVETSSIGGADSDVFDWLGSLRSAKCYEACGSG